MLAAAKSGGAGKQGRKKIRVGLGQKEEHRIRARLRGNSGDPSRADADGAMLPVENPHNGTPFTYYPSEPWIDASFLAIDDVDADGRDISVRFHNPHAKLPEGMVRCPECARRTPPNAMEGGRCADCRTRREHEMHGPSPSATAIAAIRHRRLRMETVKLASEKKSALRNEIRHFDKTGKLPS